MTPPTVIALLGFGLGALLVAKSRSDPRASTSTLRDRTIEAQKISARASRVARDLAARWSAEQ